MLQTAAAVAPAGTRAEPFRLRLDDLTDRLFAHEVYRRVRSADDLRLFMSRHVFAVWDFMTLLKSLQRKLTGVELPWMPTPDPVSRRLINEIVLGEESDEDGRGGHLSHFELYLKAMRDAGADTAPVERFLTVLRETASPETALRQAGVPAAVADFVRHTLSVAAEGDARPHAVAAAFTYGREDVIPEMFSKLVAGMAGQDPQRFGRFRYYLERHIHADGEQHGPMAHRLVARLCGDHPGRTAEAEAAARAALQKRLALWDAIAAELG
jgi:hypothetical protein